MGCYRSFAQAAGGALFIASLASAAWADDATMWTGYRPIKDVSLPYAEVVAKAVVMIQAPSLDVNGDGSDYEMVDVASVKKVTDVQVLNTDTRAMQIETCRKQSLKSCPVFPYFTNGSGIIDNGTTLYTCRHVINNWVLVAAQENGLTVDQVTPPIVITDLSRYVLYNAAIDQQLTFSAINTDPRMISAIDVDSNPLGTAERNLYFRSEYVEMRAAKNLIAPVSLQIRKGLGSARDVLEPVYLSGYPGKTSFFGGKQGDAPGYELMTSAGKLTTHRDPGYFIANALGTGGLSGGAATDRDGLILGMFCKYQQPIDLSNILSLSFFLDREYHEANWKR